MKAMRQLGCLGLMVGVVGLGSLLAWVVLRYSTPIPTLIPVGHVEDYSPGQAPRLYIEKPEPFYVLNVGGELIALTARSDRLVRCIVRWQAAAARFVDPCLGTHFSVLGEYRGKGPPGELRRLPLKVQDDQVWVELGYR